MAQHLLLSSLLIIGFCLFFSTSGESTDSDNILESFRFFTIRHDNGTCKSHTGQLLTIEDVSKAPRFRPEIKTGKGRKSQWWIVIRSSSSTTDKKIYQIINVGKQDNYLTGRGPFIANPIAAFGKNLYTLKKADVADTCFSYLEDRSAFYAPCNSSDPQQYFLFTVVKDPEAQQQQTTSSPKPEDKTTKKKDPENKTTTRMVPFPSMPFTLFKVGLQTNTTSTIMIQNLKI